MGQNNSNICKTFCGKNRYNESVKKIEVGQIYYLTETIKLYNKEDGFYEEEIVFCFIMRMHGSDNVRRLWWG